MIRRGKAQALQKAIATEEDSGVNQANFEENHRWTCPGFAAARRRHLSKSIKRSRGLSYIEILTVLVIITIMSTTGLLTYRQTRLNMRLKDGATELKNVMGVARAMAISQNRFYSVRLDFTAGNYWIDEFVVDNGVLRRSRPKLTTPKALPDFIHFERVFVQHIVDPVLSNGLSEFIAAPVTGSQFVDIFFSPRGTSDYASINLLRDAANSTNPGEYYSVRLFSSTAVAELLANQQVL